MGNAALDAAKMTSRILQISDGDLFPPAHASDAPTIRACDWLRDKY
jgi:hypothetical protein